jgi:OOP family OmpA-OmpF porin
MKKKVFAVLFFVLASLVNYVQATEQNGWYFGTKLGWSYIDPFQLKYNSHIKQSKIVKDDFSVKEKFSAPIIGLFLGYEVNPYLSFEVDNSTNGFFPHKIFDKYTRYMQSHSLELTTKLSCPITDSFHIYTRLGGFAFWNDLLSQKEFRDVFTKNSIIYPSVSLGAEYVFNNQLITRLDYTWKNKVKKIIDSSWKPSLGNAIFSLGWKFGNSDMDLVSLYDDVNSNSTSYPVLNEQINFSFDSADLKPMSYDKLNKLDDDIQKMKLKNISIVLSGHSDRIGNQEYNQTLSENRAYSIKNYLTSRGFSRDSITVQGMGKQYPLTNQVCNDIKNKSLLISCLAPDRRVEIEILSNTK